MIRIRHRGAAPLTWLASIRPDVTRRLLLLAAISAVLTAACTDLPEAEVSFGEGRAFVPLVADALDDVGLGASLGVDADGQPLVSYFGFPAQNASVAVTRPINSAFLPAVQLTTVKDGIFVRGAVAMVQDPPAPQYVVPFGPDAIETLDGLDRDNASGTALAVTGDGTAHVAWSGHDGVWYAAGTDSFSVEQVQALEGSLSQAGPLGPPSITADQAGNPWISFQVVTPRGVEVRVATPAEDGWDVQVTARTPLCNGCPQPGAAPIGVLDDAPVVAFADPVAGDVKQSVLGAQGWTTTTGIAGVDAQGLSLVADGETGYLSYYADGAVRVARSNGATWTSADVADVDLGQAADTIGALAPTTDLALDEEGTVYVAWQDTEGVHMASGDGSTFEALETRDTDGGVTPSIAVTPDAASVYLSWYQPERQDLLLGVLGELGDIVLANPSPIPPPEGGGGGVDDTCGADGAILLDIVAQNTAFDTNCLVGPAGEPFVITFENLDPPPNLHNVSAYTEQGGDPLYPPGAAFGSDTVEYEVPAQEPGAYFFQCDVHPTVMTGTLAVIGGGGGGDGGGGGGDAGAGGSGTPTDAGAPTDAPEAEA